MGDFFKPLVRSSGAILPYKIQGADVMRMVGILGGNFSNPPKEPPELAGPKLPRKGKSLPCALNGAGLVYFT